MNTIMEDLCRFCDVRDERDVQKALEEHPSLSRDDLMLLVKSAKCYINKESTKSDVVKTIMDIMRTNEFVGRIILGDMERHVDNMNDRKDLVHLSDEEIRTELKRARRKIDLMWRIMSEREAVQNAQDESDDDNDNHDADDDDYEDDEEAEDQMVDAEYENGIFPWCTGIPLRTYVKKEFLKLQNEPDSGRGTYRYDKQMYEVACERYIMYAKEDASINGVVYFDTSDFVFDTFDEFIQLLPNGSS